MALVAHAFIPRTPEAEAGRSLSYLYHPGVQSKCQYRLQSYTEKRFLEIPKKKEQGVVTHIF